MALPTLFCPRCGSLILKTERCPVCDWLRPSVEGGVGQPVWAVALEARLPRSGARPVALDRLVYVPTDQSQIVALDTAARPEEAIKWRYQFDQRYQAYSAAVWQEYLLLGSEYTGGFPAPQGELIILSAKSGDEVWRLPIEGASLSVPIVHEGLAYFTVNTGWLYAVDLVARREVWRRPIPSPWSWAPAAPLLTPTHLLVLASRSDQLVAYQIQQKEIRWTFPAGGWFPYTPAWAEDLIYTRCWDRHVYALEAASGREIWRYRAPRDYSSELWVGEACLSIGVKDYQGGAAGGQRAYALYTLDRPTGQRVGRYEVKGHIEARPVGLEQAIFFATDDGSRELESQGTFYALDAQGQHLLWEPCVVEQRFQSNLLVLDDLVIAGTRQGAIYAIRWREALTSIEAPPVYLERGEWENAAIAYAWQGAYTQAAEIYARELEQPLRAGQLYLQADEYRQVIDLLRQSAVEAERALAIQAAQAMPEAAQRAEALDDLGEHLAAAKIFVEIEDWLQAGACYEAAQAWAEARAVYFQAKVWDKWDQLTRQLELWDELIERLLQVGDYAQAAGVYLARGLFSKAADCYDRAGLPAEAFAAYSRINPEMLTEQAQRRLAELAEAMGETDMAIQAYQALRQWSKAAELAEAAGQYTQALTLYQEGDQSLKAADLLAKMARYVEAAKLFEQASQWGRAAENLERQVDLEIEQAGGVRHARKNEQIETWLERALTLFEEEANEAEEARIDDYHHRADRCRVKLMQLRQEPLLRLSLQADRLLASQGNAIHYTVENVGWGAADHLVLTLSGDFLRRIDPLPLRSLGRRQKVEGRVSIVPEIAGEITLRVELHGQAKSGELHESFAQTMPVAKLAAESSQGATLNIRNYIGPGLKSLPLKEAAIAGRGTPWEEESATPVDELDTVAVSPAQLKQQMAARQEGESTPGYDPVVVRKLLQAVFNEEALTEFCYDYFADVYAKFSRETPYSQKIQLLTKYCQTRQAFADLLDRIETQQPAQYQQFSQQLRQA